MKKRKHNSQVPKTLYKVLWSYEDNVGLDSGVLDVYATSHKEAEEIFYKNNRKLIVGTTSKGKPVINFEGGYVVESILTEAEWKQEGCPTRV